MTPQERARENAERICHVIWRRALDFKDEKSADKDIELVEKALQDAERMGRDAGLNEAYEVAKNFTHKPLYTCCLEHGLNVLNHFRKAIEALRKGES